MSKSLLRKVLPKVAGISIFFAICSVLAVSGCSKSTAQTTTDTAKQLQSKENPNAALPPDQAKKLRSMGKGMGSK